MTTPCLALDSTGRQPAVPLRMVSGPAAVATRIRLRLDSIRGSWLEDIRIGLIDLDLLDLPATPPVVWEGRARAQLREVNGVLSVDSVVVTKSGSSMSIAASVTVDSGDTGPVRVTVFSDSDEPAPGAWYRLIVGR